MNFDEGRDAVIFCAVPREIDDLGAHCPSAQRKKENVVAFVFSSPTSDRCNFMAGKIRPTRERLVCTMKPMPMSPTRMLMTTILSYHVIFFVLFLLFAPLVSAVASESSSLQLPTDEHGDYDGSDILAVRVIYY